MDLHIEVGDLLVAPPGIPDSRFDKSVLLITSHDIDHTLAVCVNRPVECTINTIIEPLGLELENDIGMFWGGPVSSNTVWMLHDPSWEVGNTVPLNRHWSITSNESMFHHLSDDDTPNRYRFMLGHAAWGPGQLEMELKGVEPWNHRHSWLVVKNPDPEWLLNDDASRIWTMATGLCSQQTVSHWMA